MPGPGNHWELVAELGCCVCGAPATIAHCHGGSISEVLDPKFRPGWAQKQNGWLVIPLCREHHQGNNGLDTCKGGVDGWEEEYGTQIYYLEEVSWQLGYCVFKRAGVSGYRYSFMDCPENACQPESDAELALE